MPQQKASSTNLIPLEGSEHGLQCAMIDPIEPDLWLQSTHWRSRPVVDFGYWPAFGGLQTPGQEPWNPLQASQLVLVEKEQVLQTQSQRRVCCALSWPFQHKRYRTREMLGKASINIAKLGSCSFEKFWDAAEIVAKGSREVLVSTWWGQSFLFG